MADGMTMTGIRLNAGQAAAEREIIEAVQARHVLLRPGDPSSNAWLLIGPAGTGKTYLMQSLVRKLQAMPRYAGDGQEQKGKLRVAVTGPTHKAVEVLSKKMQAAGIGVECCTIHSLLGLKPAVGDSEQQVLKRGNKSSAGNYDVVVLDEASMVGHALQGYIDHDLAGHFVLYVGDDAQLPPVGEVIAPVFARMPPERTSRLTEIVRQAAGNPILQAATVLRLQQGEGKPVDWSWCQGAESPDGRQGLFVPGSDVLAWMQDAFTSQDFRADNDNFRYIAYTNERVHQVNAMVREWIYGKTDTPFVVGERVLCRNPVQDERGAVAFSTNEEALIAEIEAGVKEYRFAALPPDPGIGKAAVAEWRLTVPVWKVRLVSDARMIGDETKPGVVCDLPQDRKFVQNADRKLVAEAKANRDRWRQRFAFLEGLADLRPVYAMTAHSSQGSTFKMGFVDVPDISKREASDKEEAKKMMYVAVTRFSDAVVIVG